jgi:hypothetical protein
MTTLLRERRLILEVLSFALPSSLANRGTDGFDRAAGRDDPPGGEPQARRETPNKEVQELGKAIDDTITATNAKIRAIRPQYPVRLHA